MDLTARWFVHRARAEVRRAERRRLRRLRAELAAYSSEADLRDLWATIDRCPEGLTREVRGILADQAQARARGQAPGRPWRAVGGY